ncbi:MAG: MBOAT family O-acyltransferase [Chitinivorax sp.]
MLFNSLTFAAFFTVLLLLYTLIGSWVWRKRLLLVGSYLFYAAWNPPYVAILAFSTVMDWWLARRLASAEAPATRKLLLLTSVGANLGLLGFFKYGAFVLANFQALLASIDIVYVPPEFSIILPVGISFYTFASLSYTVDVYRREIRADASLSDYALFVSFFPHLVAGPIVRARLFLPQLQTPRSASKDQLGWGMALLVIGLFAKVVMADGLLAPVVNQVYAAPENFSALDTWLAIFAFSGQIFYDFSGYSTCAIGIALCFGFEFPDNFRYPYAARSFSDFWRRWHISLSTWLRDYLYIPLGGNRGATWKVQRSLFLTMLIGGLWHGASWLFVIWGALHGFYLALERLLRGPVSQHAKEPTLFAGLLVFVIVSLTWIPFRAPDMATAVEIIQGVLRFSALPKLAKFEALLAFGAILATLVWHNRMRHTSLEALFAQNKPIQNSAMLAGAILLIFLFSGGERHAFIYFQF